MHYIWHLFWIVPLLGGSIAAATKAIGEANERRAERAQERYRLKQQVRLARVQAKTGAAERADARAKDIRELTRRHQEIIDRWAAYELDPVRLLEYPLMADVREPLVAAFHHAMLDADSLRPSDPGELSTREDVAEYRSAVHRLATAFDAAEAEALRRGWADFDDAEQDRIGRAQKLLGIAGDEAASPAERAQALERARTELAGLIVLPRRTAAALERRVARALEQ